MPSWNAVYRQYWHHVAKYVCDVKAYELVKNKTSATNMDIFLSPNASRDNKEFSVYTLRRMCTKVFAEGLEGTQCSLNGYPLGRYNLRSTVMIQLVLLVKWVRC
jgi:hypothetical protein